MVGKRKAVDDASDEKSLKHAKVDGSSAAADDGGGGAAAQNIAQFFSKSKDVDDLGCGMPDWRKRLSNFWPSEITVDGTAYPSVEHAFHAMKALHCSDKPEMAAWFTVTGALAKAQPGKVKSMGGKGTYTAQGAVLDVPKWNARRDEVTIAALRARARSDAAFRRILLATHVRGMYLLHFERGGARAYWGGCVDKETGKVKGSNRLGELMMTVREELTKEDAGGAEAE